MTEENVKSDAEITEMARRSRLLRQLDAQDEARRRRNKPPSAGHVTVLPPSPQPKPPTPAAAMPDHVLKAFLLLDPSGAWTPIDRPYTGWLSTIPALVEGHNFQLSSVPVVRRARLTVAGMALRVKLGKTAEPGDLSAKTFAQR